MPRPANDVDFSELEAAARIHDGPGRGHKPGAALAIMALIVGWLWLIGAAAGAYAFLGLQGLLALAPAAGVALAVAAVMPAFMVWFAGAAAQEAARARSEAGRLADAADQLSNPSPVAEAATRRLAVAVRGEIAALDRALDSTLAKLDSVDRMIGAHTRAVEDAAALAQEGASGIVAGLDQERQALLAISQDLEGQVSAITETIQRQSRQVAEAARTADEGVRVADETLDARLSSFGAAAALIVDRTRQLSAAAQDSSESAGRLEDALEKALDVLARATKLTDAARQSADEASLAANATAGAVRETTARAVEEARHAANMIRNEGSSATERGRTFAPRLSDAPAPRAEPLRTADPGPAKRFSLFGRAAAKANDERPAEPERPIAERPASRPMFGARSQPSGEAPPPIPANERDQQSQVARQPERETKRLDAPNPVERSDRLERTDRFDRMAENDRMTARQEPRVAQGGGGWTWRDLMSAVDSPETSAPARRASEPTPASTPAPTPLAPPEREDALSRLTRSVSHLRPVEPASGLAVVEACGVRLPEVFSMAALDRIAHRARNGTQARRRAVKDAAADAVARLDAYLASNPQARQDASGFMSREGARIAELLGRGRASMSSDATRAFLLIDAAIG